MDTERIAKSLSWGRSRGAGDEDAGRRRGDVEAEGVRWGIKRIAAELGSSHHTGAVAWRFW